MLPGCQTGWEQICCLKEKKRRAQNKRWRLQSRGGRLVWLRVEMRDAALCSSPPSKRADLVFWSSYMCPEHGKSTHGSGCGGPVGRWGQCVLELWGCDKLQESWPPCFGVIQNSLKRFSLSTAMFVNIPLWGLFQAPGHQTGLPQNLRGAENPETETYISSIQLFLFFFF